MAHLRESRGKIVVVSSVTYWLPFPKLSLYCGSKGALMSLFETLRVEVGSDVKITLVNPGIIEYEMTTISKNLTVKDAAKATNEWWIDFVKKLRFPVKKVEVCAEAIVRSVCRCGRYLTEPKWVLSTYWIKLLCPELLEFLQRLLTIEFCKKFM